MKAWIILIGTLALAGLVGGGIAYKSRTTDDGTISVETELVGLQTVVQTVTSTGRIQPQTQVNISADVSAKITTLAVEEGDWVESGQLLLELDRERITAAVESAEASLRSAEANVTLIKENQSKLTKDLARSKSLFDEKLESPAALDAVESALKVENARRKVALDQVEEARAALRQARDDLSKTTIYSPMAGTVSVLNKEQGEMALGSQFQEDVILVVSDLEGMEALVEVDENDIVLVSIGDKATIEVDALPGVELEGVVSEIANSASISGEGTTDQKTEFQVKITVSTIHEQLRPGMTATADVVTETKVDVIGVPIQAVAVRTLEQLGAEAGERFEADRDGFVEIVWVVEEGEAVAIQVETGIQSDSHIEIASGLEADQNIVTGSFRAISRDLTDGSEVSIDGDEPVEG